MMEILKLEHMDRDELRVQIVRVTHDLVYWTEELGRFTQDHRRSFLTRYIQSPGGSVAAKEKDAEFGSLEESNMVIDAKARVDSLTITRDLIELLLI
jgi:hypothetical protein